MLGSVCMIDSQQEAGGYDFFIYTVVIMDEEVKSFNHLRAFQALEVAQVWESFE